MGKVYAAGKYAFGFCDRCNCRWPLGDLKTEFYVGRPKNNRVCPECWDPDHPQNFLGRTPIDDPQALRDPRPDPSQSQVATWFGWNPIASAYAYSHVGTLTVALPMTVSLEGVSATGAAGTIEVVT